MFFRVNTRVYKLRFYSTIFIIYALTIGFGWYVVHPVSALNSSRYASLTRSQQKPHIPLVKKIPVISGLPNRIVIPASSVDLPIIPGYYDSTTDTWTLSGYDAQFAMISSLANNTEGQTFIYGHNNNYVFGALRHVTPSPGAQALIYTTNGHIFSYTFTSVQSIGPNDVAILNYSGPSTLLIQTCTGSLNEWRTEYSFVFNKVEQ